MVQTEIVVAASLLESFHFSFIEINISLTRRHIWNVKPEVESTRLLNLQIIYTE